MKTCFSCKEEKPFEDFYKDETQKDRLNFNCKICYKIKKEIDNEKRNRYRIMAAPL